MMYNFPFYPHFPTKSYRSYPQSANMSSGSKDYGRNYRKSTANSNKNKNVNSKGITRDLESTNFSKYKDESKKSNVDKENYLEILGIKLYSDDILLLCLIFFLYKEGVQDEYLFISLIMLLLS